MQVQYNFFLSVIFAVVSSIFFKQYIAVDFKCQITKTCFAHSSQSFLHHLYRTCPPTDWVTSENSNFIFANFSTKSSHKISQTSRLVRHWHYTLYLPIKMDKICPSYKSSSRSRTTILFSASSLLIHSSKFYKVQWASPSTPLSQPLSTMVRPFHQHHHIIFTQSPSSSQLLTLPLASVQLPSSNHFTKYNQHHPYHKSPPTSHNFTTITTTVITANITTSISTTTTIKPFYHKCNQHYLYHPTSSSTYNTILLPF